MKINLLDKFKALDDRISGFTPTIITEEEYELYEDMSENGFIKTPKWIVYLYKKKSKDNVLCFMVAISTYIEIISCQQNLSTKERSYCVKIFDGNENVMLTLDSSILTSAGTRKLLQHGCVFDESNLRYLLQYLAISACNAPIEYVHTGVGWLSHNDAPVYLSSESIGNSETKSKYIGGMYITPKGSKNDYLKMLDAEVIGNSTLEFGFVLAHSAPILGYLNKCFDLGCLIFNFGNSSSKGKTTAGMLIASAFGNPAIGKSLVSTLDGTEQSLVTFVANADSHPVVLDELGTASTKNVRRLLYQFASGKERSRNDKEGNNKKSRTFNNVIVTTSEFPIIDETAPDGVRARVFQISSDITSSAQNADNIKKCVYSNYGHTGIEFVKFIVTNKLDSIIEDYENDYTALIDVYENNDLAIGKLTKRILSKLAVILLTARYLRECFPLDISLKSIVKTIIELERSVAEEQDVSEKALDCIRQYVATHKSHFIFGCDEWVSTVEGKVRGSGSGRELIILKSTVEKILKDNGFENCKTIYQMWSDKKILVREKDRPYKRLRLVTSLPTMPCFIFKITD